jgi:hypothetical protein
MKKLFLLLAFVFIGIFAFSSVSPNKTIADPYECWDTADAIETISCGYVGCDYWLWDQVYTACMGNKQ